MKANYAADGEIVNLHWNDGVFVPDKTGETGDPNATERAEEEDFLMLLDEFKNQNREVSHKPTANNYAPAEFAGKKNRKKHIYEKAMDRLFWQRRIKVEQYGPPSRGWSKVVRCDPPKRAARRY